MDSARFQSPAFGQRVRLLRRLVSRGHIQDPFAQAYSLLHHELYPSLHTYCRTNPPRLSSTAGVWRENVVWCDCVAFFHNTDTDAYGKGLIQFKNSVYFCYQTMEYFMNNVAGFLVNL
jgi:hypothetical protein